MAIDSEVALTPLAERDLVAADELLRAAFGTALGLPEPARFAEGAELVRTRWRADPTCAFAAHRAGELVGCAFLARRGSYVSFGPLAVRPDHWDRGIGRLLWEIRMPMLERWGATHAALFTRIESKNIHLYQRYGFWPRELTALSAKPLAPAGEPRAGEGGRAAAPWSTLSELPMAARQVALDDCRRLADSIQPGLDPTGEILAVEAQALGTTILIYDDGGLGGFAICHVGAGSEAGPGACYVKLAAAAPGPDAERRLERLLDACERHAVAHGAVRLLAGVNIARREAYRVLLDRGHRPFAFGVAMHRPDEPAYDRPGALVVDDGR
ncbi:MAG: GNAT family N-acetyltransferase [Solirubrobacteraceae bacterium]|nr:GNAT family N-acetyltransferase [Solirubrobacteraceae bacterium]